MNFDLNDMLNTTNEDDIQPMQHPLSNIDNVILNTETQNPTIPREQQSQRIISIDGQLSESISTFEQMQNQGLAEIKTAKYNNKAIAGFIDGLRIINDNYFVQVNYNNSVSVLIRGTEFLRNEMKDNPKMPITEQRIYLMPRLGSKVYFVPTSEVQILDQTEDGEQVKKYYCSGSKTRGDNFLQKKYLMKNRETGKYLVEIGRTIECQIMVVQSHFIIINCFGIEKQVSFRDVDTNRYKDLRQVYSNSQTILAKITNITRTTKYVVENGLEKEVVDIDIEVSTKDVKIDRQKKRLQEGKYQVDCVYTAKITYIDSHGYYYTQLQDGMTVSCSYKTVGEGAKVGDNVLVAIKKINYNYNKLSGVIIKNLGAKSQQIIY